MAAIIILSLVIIILGLIIGAAILLLVSKWFKILNPTYKKSLLVVFALGIGSTIACIIFSIIDLGIVSNILITLTSFLVFHLIFKKYYQTGWVKSLSVYVTFSLIATILALAAILPLRLFVISPFVVRGEAMSPAYSDGEYLMINKLDKEFGRGDVVIIKQEETYIIKRIVGLPRDKIRFEGPQIYINDEAYLKELGSIPVGEGEITLNQDQYYVLGDNLAKSLDSRSFGPVSKSDIVGKIFSKLSN